MLVGPRGKFQRSRFGAHPRENDRSRLAQIEIGARALHDAEPSLRTKERLVVSERVRLAEGHALVAVGVARAAQGVQPIVAEHRSSELVGLLRRLAVGRGVQPDHPARDAAAAERDRERRLGGDSLGARSPARVGDDDAKDRTDRCNASG